MLFTHALLIYRIAATFGFEETSYTVREDEGEAEVCVAILQPPAAQFDISFVGADTSSIPETANGN